MVDPHDARRARYVDRAYEAVESAALDDLLQFIALRKLAGSATARFYDVFPDGREELIAALQRDATDPSQPAVTAFSSANLRRLLRLVSDIKDRSPDAIDVLKEVAQEEFDSYFEPGGKQEARELVRGLMAIAARRDEHAQERMRVFYAGVNRDYSELCSALLKAVERRPIDSLGTVANFAAVLTALYDGLGVLARVESTERARDLLAAVLIPIVAGLTQPTDQPSRNDAELLFARDVQPES